MSRSSNHSSSSSSKSELAVLGPDLVPAWEDLSNIGKLCLVCQDLFEDLKRIFSTSPEDQDSSYAIHCACLRGDKQRNRTPGVCLWTDDSGPCVRQLRNGAHWGCHFCTLILSQLLVGRLNLKLGAGHETLGFNRKRQDKLYENDHISLHLNYSEKTPRSYLEGGINIWCAEGDRRASTLFENVREWGLSKRRRYFSEDPTDEGFLEYCHQLAIFGFVISHGPASTGTQTRQNEDIFESRLARSSPGEASSCESVRVKDKKENDLLGISSNEPRERSAYDIKCYHRVRSAEAIARYWLKGCLQDCTCGSRSGDDPVLPTRLINLGEKCASGAFIGKPFLFQTNNERGKYATLSYRWGQEQHFKTTHKTLKERYYSIPMEEMPQTFKDVVQLVRAMDLQYLWIDALCIIQDSKEDCEKELAKMSEIYSNSAVTVVTIGSFDVSHGCAPNRNKLAMANCPVSSIANILSESRNQFELLTEGPVHQRGWCLQEGEISSRLLFVGGSQLFWQCQRGSRRESNYEIFYDSNSRDSDADADVLIPESWPMRSRLFDNASVSNPNRVHGEWWNLIQSYTRRLLTFQSDKLPAISAMAQRITGIFEKEEDRPKPADYCCGLWRQELLPGLLWGRWLRKGAECAFRHPSWSWAASEGEIEFKFDSIHAKTIWYAEILDVSIELESQLNPFGAVRSGKLTLFGPVAWLPGVLFERDDDAWSRYKESQRRRDFQDRRSTSSPDSIVQSLITEDQIRGPSRESNQEAGEVRLREGRVGDRDLEDECFTGHPGQPGQKEPDHPATPTPSTPITPVHPQTFAGSGKGTLATTAGGAANSNPTLTSNPSNPQNQQQIPPPGPMPGAGPSGDPNFPDQPFNLDFSGLETTGVLNDFDFDSFLNTDDGSNWQLGPSLGPDSADDDSQSDRSNISVFNASSSPGKEGSAHESQRKRRGDDQSTLSNKSSQPRGFRRIGIPWLYSGAAVRFDIASPSRQPTPADGCRCLRVTELYGMILAPVQRPGTGRGGGLYERVGLIDLTCASEEEARQFENFKWVHSVVTII